ncbi:MAG: hypothetical protein IPP32_05330 [Bacteroidetes bacterium]|nr:hypothetical protein [Bacteroidota bacterium]
MEAEIKNNTSETTQITFKLTQDERQTIEESAGDLDLNISEYCRLKSLMDENTVLTQKRKISDLEKEVKLMKVKLDFYKNSERTPEHHIVLDVTKEERETFEKMFGDFMTGENDLSFNLIEALICFYGKLKDEEHDFFLDKISKEEVDDVFYIKVEKQTN